MQPNRLTTLFSESRPRGYGFSGFATSSLFHGAGLGLLFSLRMVPAFHAAAVVVPPNPTLLTRYLEPVPEEKPVRTTTHSGGAVAQGAPVPEEVEQAVVYPTETTKPALSRQILIQMAAPEVPVPQQIRIPSVVTWTLAPPVPNVTVAANITPPRPEIRPSAEIPNIETTVSDIRLSATPAPSTLQVASTTLPVMPAASAQQGATPAVGRTSLPHPASGAMISLSDVPMSREAQTIPLARTSSFAAPAETNIPGSSLPADTRSDSAKNGSQQSVVALHPGTLRGAGTSPGVSTAMTQTQGAGSGAGTSGPTSLLPGETRILRPKDGQFGVVVVNPSVQDEYPEAESVWHGRIAYSVFLHMERGRNWILQYTMGAGAGRPEAAWPYEMVRPPLTEADFDAGPIMVHGFVNTTGRFEDLQLVATGGASAKAELLHALEQWQFRPARSNGQATKLEVLLIIPDTLE